MKAMPPPARVLPLEAALALQRASQVKNTRQDPLARAKAVNRAIRYVRLQYPMFFRPVPLLHQEM